MALAAPEVRGLHIFPSIHRTVIRPVQALFFFCSLALVLLGNPAHLIASTSSLDLKAKCEGAATSFELDDLNGNLRSLDEFRGQTILLHFFATWCEPCREEMESLRRLQQRMAQKSFAIIAVDVAEVDLRVRAFFEKAPVEFPVLLDREQKIAKNWCISALPSTYVLDTELKTKLFVEGDLDWSRPEVIKKIENLFPLRTSTDPRSRR